VRHVVQRLEHTHEVVRLLRCQCRRVADLEGHAIVYPGLCGVLAGFLDRGCIEVHGVDPRPRIGKRERDAGPASAAADVKQPRRIQ